MPSVLETSLRAKREAGRTLFVPYVTGGLEGVDEDLLRGLADAGADAIEIGVPFSDPIMDGGVIQHASERALARGFHPRDAFTLTKDAALEIPVVLMTYYNPILAMGEETWCEAAVESGVSGFIVPDLPVDEGEGFAARCVEHNLAPVFLAAPGTTPERLQLVAEHSGGFVYCVATYGVTGARDQLEGTAQELVAALRPLTDIPLLVGVGITTPDHAVAAAAFADGVIVGSAIVRCLVDEDPAGAIELARSFRTALDA